MKRIFFFFLLYLSLVETLPVHSWQYSSKQKNSCEEQLACENDGDCTLAGATGTAVSGNGTIILKNRDRKTRFIQRIVRIKKTGQNEIIGITSFNDEITAGINSSGLIVVSSSIGGVERKGKTTRPEVILAKCSSVDEFISNMLEKGLVKGPMNYMVGDAKKLIDVEVFSRRKYSVREITDSFFAHTNHYFFPEMVPYQKRRPERSSIIRRARARYLLEKIIKDRKASGFTGLETGDFLTIARDHYPFPGNLSICRHCENTEHGSTISSAIFVSRPGKKPFALLAVSYPCSTFFIPFTFDDETGPLFSDGNLSRFTELKNYVIWRSLSIIYHSIQTLTYSGFFNPCPSVRNSMFLPGTGNYKKHPENCRSENIRISDAGI